MNNPESIAEFEAMARDLEDWANDPAGRTTHAAHPPLHAVPRADLTEATATQAPPRSQRPKSRPGGGYLKFRNDRGVPKIRIGVREFKCIGVSPPQDHPHVYINMGEADTILCPYCGTRFHFDPRLTSLDADPADSLFTDDIAA
jgi:uncharacterized Zn-finger protein